MSPLRPSRTTAQDVAKIAPDLVSVNPSTTLMTLDYTSFVAPLVKSVQELKAANDNMAAENALLRKELEAIKRRVGM